MSAMSVVEFLLWAVLGFLFWKKNLHRRFPAMGGYLALRVASTPVLLFLLSGHVLIDSQVWLISYFFLFWAVYIASAVLLFFICIEVFRSALAAFTGLMKFGIVVFRWAALASVIVSLSTVSFAHRGILIIPDIAYGLMRSVSILELCLLAFLCLSMNALRLPIRDLSFGIALLFGVISANDFTHSLVVTKFSSLTAPAQFFYEALILFALGSWVAYCALPEPVRKPVVMAVNSTIYRWNEIASALGHTGTRVAVHQPANSFFLTDVERVVEKVLTRSLREKESEV
jgi:hypothetical protein